MWLRLDFVYLRLVLSFMAVGAGLKMGKNLEKQGYWNDLEAGRIYSAQSYYVAEDLS